MKKQRVNELGQPIGDDLKGWSPPLSVRVDELVGRHVRLERIGQKHAADLFAAFTASGDIAAWTYLPYGPFSTEDELHEWLLHFTSCDDPWMFALVDSVSGKACGVASYLRIKPESGSVEVGHIHYSPLLKQRIAATEAMYLMAENAFKAGYRRYEWKCDALNAPSRAAALRLGFSFEGIFRQATFYKGRNRDTAWFGIIDKEWQKLRDVYLHWLDDDNFNDPGAQAESLSSLTANALSNQE